jgi:nucleoid DNA-binding protein
MTQEKIIIQKLATKYNLPLQKVEEIIFYQFKYVAKIMKSGDFQSVRLQYFGKFHAKKGRIAHLNEKTRKKNERLANSK